MVTVVKCPTCSTAVTWDAAHPFKPFCSERCKLIDLGEWASEGHRIEGESKPAAADGNPLDSDEFAD